jgi:hypothetical protein
VEKETETKLKGAVYIAIFFAIIAVGAVVYWVVQRDAFVT